jgi:hypothetical protein
VSKTSYFVQLFSYFFGIMLIANIVCIYFGITPRYIDGALLIILVGNLAAKYMTANESSLSSKEYWSLFFISLAIYTTYNILMLIYVSFFMILTPKFIFLVVTLVIALGALCSFFGLWRAKRIIEKSTPKLIPIKVHSVTDESIAAYVIDELSKHQIDAFIHRLDLQHDPLLSTLPSDKINIMLKDSNDVDKATQIIYNLFEEDDYEPWNCPECRVHNDGSFFICWKCGYEQT